MSESAIEPLLLRFCELVIGDEFRWRDAVWKKTRAHHAVCLDSDGVETEEFVPNDEPIERVG